MWWSQVENNYSGTSECGHTLGPSILSFVERLSSFRGYFVQSLYTTVHLLCPSFRGLSSFGVSFIGGFTDIAMYELLEHFFWTHAD